MMDNERTLNKDMSSSSDNNGDTRSQDFFKQILDNIHVGILVCDPQGIIKYFNKSWGKLNKLDPSLSIGHPIVDFVPNSAIPQIIETGKPDIAVTYLGKNRETIVNRTPIKIDEKLSWIVTETIFHDIALFKKLAREMDLLKSKIEYLKETVNKTSTLQFTFDDIIGDTPQITSLKKQAKKFARSSEPILLISESGTGKEMFAQAIHQESGRRNEMFVTVNCASIPRDLLELELFGYEEGAFTGARKKGKIGKFELADKGTIFLDEIGDLPVEMQAKLLRVIEYNEIEKIGGLMPISCDFRLIAATNKNLEELIRHNRFREDLYYRLNVLTLTIPTLKERTDDIPQIARHLLNTCLDSSTSSTICFGEDVLQFFKLYAWPGNVRELKNIIKFALFALEEGQQTISLQHLPPYLLAHQSPQSKVNKHSSVSLRKIRETAEREAISECLHLTKNNITQAASLLGITRPAIYKKIKKYGLINNQK